MSGHDLLLTETIARHFDGASIDGAEIDLGLADLHIACRVDAIRPIGTTYSASLFFYLWGGALGEAPIFASVSGYGGSAEEAIVTGGCNWACVFGPVLEAALSDKEPEEAERFEVTIHGRRYLGVVDGLDRAMLVGSDEGDDGVERTKAARLHLGAGPWLVTGIIESGTLPVLPLEHAVVISVFCWESAQQRTLEVKVNGADWPPSMNLLDERAPLPGRGIALLRELAVLVPQGAPGELSRELLAHSLAGAAANREPRALTAWAGWTAHRGELGEPASETAVERLETEIGSLPPDYKDFLLRVQSEGAGPGYGLVSPFGVDQARIATGELDWEDGREPRSEPSGVLVLAHAGCGVMWLLVVSGPHRGEVWVDAAGSDGLARSVAPSFESWYRDWLDALIRNDSSFSQWDARCCATPSVLSQMLESIESEGIEGDAAVAALPDRLGDGAISLASGGSRYFDPGDALDPCQPCSSLVTGLGMGPAVFRPGSQPRQAREARRGFLGRLFGPGRKA